MSTGPATVVGVPAGFMLTERQNEFQIELMAPIQDMVDNYITSAQSIQDMSPESGFMQTLNSAGLASLPNGRYRLIETHAPNASPLRLLESYSTNAVDQGDFDMMRKHYAADWKGAMSSAEKVEDMCWTLFFLTSKYEYFLQAVYWGNVAAGFSIGVNTMEVGMHKSWNQYIAGAQEFFDPAVQAMAYEGSDGVVTTTSQSFRGTADPFKILHPLLGNHIEQTKYVANPSGWNNQALLGQASRMNAFNTALLLLGVELR